MHLDPNETRCSPVCNLILARFDAWGAKERKAVSRVECKKGLVAIQGSQWEEELREGGNPEI